MVIRAISPKDSWGIQEMEQLLRSEGIKKDRNLDYFCGLYDEEEELLATGSCFGNTIRCLAVSGASRGQGLLVQVVSHLMDVQARRGNLQVFLYTKPSNLGFFKDLGFSEVARGKTAVLLENRQEGLERYCANLKSLPGNAAAVVMNANPFTLGHRHLLEQAAKSHDVVHLFLLSQESGPIPFALRKRLVRSGIEGLQNVILQETGPYMISSATFPGYFFREEDEAIAAQAELDIAVFSKIAKTLDITHRYVGEEPTSHVTSLYNQIMAERLPNMGIQCHIVPRLKAEGKPISASTVRQAIHDGRLEDVKAMLPESTWRYFSSPEGSEIVRAIRQEKDVIHY